MTKRQFWAVVIVFVLVFGPVGYFSYDAYKESKIVEREIKAKERETALQLEQERTKQSENRWQHADKMLQRIPFMKKD